MIGIGNYGMNALYSGYAQMNNQRLQQIMNQRSTGPISKVPAVNTGSTDFLKEYQSKMSGLMQAANSMTTGSGKDKMAASSSDTKVADATLNFRTSQEASYTLDVEQIATAQKNETARMVGASASPSASGTLSLETNYGKRNFSVSSAAGSNREQYTALADKINKSGLGVQASVVENKEKGTIGLALTSKGTGEKQGFIASGSFAQASGLSDVTQAAQDAKYSVQKQGSSEEAKSFTSASNDISVGDYRLSATLKGTGSTKISIGKSNGVAAGDVQNLVDKYNDTLKFLDKNAKRGIGVLQQLKRMVTPPISERSMERIGITTNKDGTLKFDQDAYQKSMEKNPDLTKDLVSGTYSLASGILRDAQQGMNISAGRLIDQDIKAVSYESSMNSIGMMSMYSRNGAYNLNNYYAVGALLSYNI